jgi:hypothetical protein
VKDTERKKERKEERRKGKIWVSVIRFYIYIIFGFLEKKKEQ